MENSQFILFDGDCGVCNRFVQFVLKREQYQKQFIFISLTSETGKKHLRNIGLPDSYNDSIVLINENKHYIKSEAALKILKNLKGMWKLLYISLLIPKNIRDFFYDLIAKNRYKIKNNDSCLMVENHKERIILK